MKLQGTDLRGADFRGANITNADLEEVFVEIGNMPPGLVLNTHDIFNYIVHSYTTHYTTQYGETKQSRSIIIT